MVAAVSNPFTQSIRPTLKAFRGRGGNASAYRSGRYIMATVLGDQSSKVWCREHGVGSSFLAAQQESANELGGFLVNDELESEIIDLRELYGIFRREAKTTVMGSDTKVVPRRAGGLTAYFGDESAAMTESNKNWDRVSLLVRKLSCLTRISNELNDDAVIDLARDLAGEIAYAFAYKEDLCGFLGDATSTYGHITGVMNALNAGSSSRRPRGIPASRLWHSTTSSGPSASAHSTRSMAPNGSSVKKAGPTVCSDCWMRLAVTRWLTWLAAPRVTSWAIRW